MLLNSLLSTPIPHFNFLFFSPCSSTLNGPPCTPVSLAVPPSPWFSYDFMETFLSLTPGPFPRSSLFRRVFSSPLWSSQVTPMITRFRPVICFTSSSKTSSTEETYDFSCGIVKTLDPFLNLSGYKGLRFFLPLSFRRSIGHRLQPCKPHYPSNPPLLIS